MLENILMWFNSATAIELLVLFLIWYKLLSGHKGLSLLWPEAIAFEKCHIKVILGRESLQLIVTWWHNNLKVIGSIESCHMLHNKSKLSVRVLKCRVNNIPTAMTLRSWLRIYGTRIYVKWHWFNDSNQIDKSLHSFLIQLFFPMASCDKSYLLYFCFTPPLPLLLPHLPLCQQWCNT